MIKRASWAPAPRVVLLSGLAAMVAVLCGYVAGGMPAHALDSGPHRLLIAVLALTAIATIVHAARSETLLAPLGVIALTMLVYFVVRPLELSLSAAQLTHSSYDQFATGLDALSSLRAQEISLYVHTRLVGSLDGALTRAMLGLTVFFLAVLAGHALPLSRRLGAMWSRIGAGAEELDVRWVIGVWLAIGVASQVLILGKIGGVSTALDQFSTTGNLTIGFVYLLALNFHTAALILWACWHPPLLPRERLLFGAAVAELAGFYLLLGSRTLVLVPLLVAVLAYNELCRPLALRTLAIAAGCAILFSSAYLSLREASRERPVVEALADVPAQAVKARAILGTSPVFDQYFIATNRIPATSPYRYGGELAQALAGQVPGFLYPSKPEANDTSFRKLIWGERFLAGRPIGAAGSLYRDFGFAGILAGGVLLGIFARALTGLRARAGGPQGRALRAALFVIGVLLVFVFTVSGYSLALGYGMTIGMPVLLALSMFARAR